MNNPSPLPQLPWWRVPVVWLVIAGPTLVVAACMVTGVLAWRGGDRPVRDTAAARADSQAPATQARNHAVTPR